MGLTTPYYTDSDSMLSLGEYRMSLILYYHWGSRSSETAFVRAPASQLGGGIRVYWQYGRQRESTGGVGALVPRR